jgi:hypothetical protein
MEIDCTAGWDPLGKQFHDTKGFCGIDHAGKWSPESNLLTGDRRKGAASGVSADDLLEFARTKSPKMLIGDTFFFDGKTELPQRIAIRREDVLLGDGEQVDALRRGVDNAIQANPITYLSQDTPPMFIAHGIGDRTVPFKQGYRLHHALDQLQISHEFMAVDGDHNEVNMTTAMRGMLEKISKDANKDQPLAVLPKWPEAERSAISWLLHGL